MRSQKTPHVVFVFADQWRAQSFGYRGDPNISTPNIDRLASESADFTHAVSGCPVCSPYRASLMTGQFPLTHGVFVNDVTLRPSGPTIAERFKSAGYATGYIGKWHLHGHGRSAPIPRDERLGFDYWKTLECTHDYQHSAYYEGDSLEKSYWDGYDAESQTRDACTFIRDHADAGPFFLMLSWGPPHAPYETAPESYRRMYDPARIELPPNVPEEREAEARRQIAGYLAHGSALDACVGMLVDTLEETGWADDTVFVFTSDHGDMLGSQGERAKQRPWDESIRVPFLLRYPGLPGWHPRKTDTPIDAPDLMPTLLGLCGIEIPDTVEGLDYSPHVAGGPAPGDGSALIMCPHPFGQWTRVSDGGREYRGVRTKQFTYVRDLEGPWLLYDNEHDPFQLSNLVNEPAWFDTRSQLDELLDRKLAERGDGFLPGMEYIEQWGYEVDERGTVPYSK